MSIPAKTVYCFTLILLVTACTNLKTSESLTEPKSYNFTISEFSFNRSKNETIEYVMNKLSSSAFYLERPEENLSFLTILYSPGQPNQFVDCGKIAITNPDNGGTQIFENTKNSYTFKKYRKNHLDTHIVKNKLSIHANIIISGDDHYSKVNVQPNFNLKVREQITSTQGNTGRQLKKYNLQLLSREHKLFDAFGTNCTSTDRFEKMIADILYKE